MRKKSKLLNDATGQNAAHLGPPAAFPFLSLFLFVFLRKTNKTKKNNEIQIILLFSLEVSV